MLPGEFMLNKKVGKEKTISVCVCVCMCTCAHTCIHTCLPDCALMCDSFDFNRGKCSGAAFLFLL